MRGSSISSTTLNASGLFTVPSFTTDNAASPRTLTSGLYGPAQITIGGVDFPLPLEAAKVMILVGLSGASNDLAGTREDAGRFWSLNAASQAYLELERTAVTPGRPNMNAIQVTVNTSTFTSNLATLQAVRFPYGEDLVS